MPSEQNNDFQRILLSKSYVLVGTTGGRPAHLLCDGELPEAVLRKAVLDIWGAPRGKTQHELRIIRLSEAELLTQLVKESISYLVEVEGCGAANRNRYFLLCSTFGENDLDVQVKRHLRNRQISNSFRLHNLTSATRIDKCRC